MPVSDTYDPNTNPLTRRGIMYGSAIASLVGSLLLQRKVLADIRQLKTKATRNAGIYQRHMGLKGIPVIKDKTNPQAAHYMPSEWAWVGNRFDDLMGSKIPAHLKKGEKTGYVVLGSEMDRPAILAHELGHAQMGTQPITSPARFNQSILRPLSGLAHVAGSAASIIGSNYLAGEGHLGTTGLQKGLAGAGIGIGTGLLTSLPTLWNEHSASKRALEGLRAAGASEDELARSQKALRSAFNTYLGGAVIMPGLASAAAAALADPKSR